MNSKRTYSKEEIRYNLETNNEWLIRGLLAIYKRQTDDEQNAGITKHDNGVGFSGCDSSFLTNAAQFYQKRGFLTAKQLVSVRKAMLKYAGQLERISKGLM